MNPCISPSITGESHWTLVTGQSQGSWGGMLARASNWRSRALPLLGHVSVSRLGSGAAEAQLPSDCSSLVTASFPSKLKPFYSTEENSELMDISIHSVISLQLPGEDNESIKVGPSGMPLCWVRTWKLTLTWAMLRVHLPEPASSV